MSGDQPKRTAASRIIQAAALVIVFGILLLATQYAPESRSVVGTVAGLGFLLLAGTLTKTEPSSARGAAHAPH